MSVSLLSDLEDMFLKRHGRQLVELEEKNRNLQAACDNLRKKLFLEENKAHTLASRLGFSDYETMDHAISSMPSVWNARTIEASRHETAALRSDRDKQIVALQNIQEMHSLSLMEITSLKDERDRLLEENKQLHSGIATANTKLLSETSSGSAAGIFTGLSGSTLGLRQNTAPSSVEDIPNSRDRAKDPTSNALTDYQQPINDDDGCTVEHLKSRLSVLNHKYDALLAAKTLAAKKYMEDYTKWKEFKLWWYENSRKTRKKKRASGHHTHSRTSVARPTVKHVTITSSDAIDRSEDASHVTTSETHTGEGKDHFLDTTVLEHPGMGSGRQTTSTPESKTTTSVQGNLTPLSKERKRMKPGDHDEVEPNRADLPESDSPWTSGDHVPQSPDEVHQHDSPCRSLSTTRLRESMAEFPALDVTLKCLNATSDSSGLNSTTRSRYRPMSETTANQTVNALFEINASNNHGLNFQFDEVVRSKAKRRHLEAEDCECCRDYYNAMGPLPPRLVPPLWNSLSSSRVKPLQSNDEHAESQADHELIERHPTEEHMRQISRHRHEWTRAATPPDYWTIGFPTTQEAENINKKAEDMHQQKRRRMENEASKQHGRFKKRL